MNDARRIEHMIEAAESALRLCEGLDEGAFKADERTYRAVVQCIEVIGEAARHVSEPTRAELSMVPWHQIVGMRHRVIHMYFHVDLSLVWRVVEHELQPLVDALTRWQEG
jgi:uncharacterized protein with HEPN domain